MSRVVYIRHPYALGKYVKALWVRDLGNGSAEFKYLLNGRMVTGRRELKNVLDERPSDG